MRLFVALPLPASVLEPLVGCAMALRPRLPPARWVPLENLHLTLRFLGDTEPRLVAGLDEALGRCFADHPPLRLRLRDGGCFPPRRPARVAWVGFEPAPALARLQSAVATAADRQLGIGSERRPYHPHLTLARPRRPWPRQAVALWTGAFAGSRGTPFTACEGHLMRSHLGPSGARHERLASYPLTGGRVGPV